MAEILQFYDFIWYYKFGLYLFVWWNIQISYMAAVVLYLS